MSAIENLNEDIRNLDAELRLVEEEKKQLKAENEKLKDYITRHFTETCTCSRYNGNNCIVCRNRLVEDILKS